ncbi:MAG: DUF202 domain-containing protein [Candidatus Cyclobacteriaceae bacterium M2_1C_046]
MKQPVLRTDQRNLFARVRTIMANERTLMSYYRTTFAIIGVGAFILEFYTSLLGTIIAAIFMIIGVGVAVYGTMRYRKFHRRIMRR